MKVCPSPAKCWVITLLLDWKRGTTKADAQALRTRVTVSVVNSNSDGKERNDEVLPYRGQFLTTEVSAE